MYYLLAWRNIWRNKRRTLITLASIAFAVFFACVMQALQLGSYESMVDNSVRFSTGHVQIHGFGYWKEKSIDNSFVYGDTLHHLLANIPEVTTAVPRLESFALVSSGAHTKGTFVVGVKPELEDSLTRLRSRIQKGSYLANGQSGVLVGEGLAKYLHVAVGDTVVLIGQGYHGVNAAGKYAVQGIVKLPSPELNNGVLYMPLHEAQDFYGARNLISSLSLELTGDKAVPAVMQAVQQHLDMTSHEVMSWREMLPELVQTIELDYRSGLILLAVLYMVIGFGIFGTFLMMTTERTYEFGIMMASGMKRRTLQLVTMVELLLLSACGVAAGMAISLPLIMYLHLNPIPLSGDIAEVYAKFGMEAVISFSVDASIFFQQAWVVLALTLVLGLYPLWFIRKLDIVRAIRG